MATHSSILTWEIPWTEHPGGLLSWGRKVLDLATKHQSRADAGLMGGLNHRWRELELLAAAATLLSHFSHVRLCAIP